MTPKYKSKDVPRFRELVAARHKVECRKPYVVYVKVKSVVVVEW